MPDGGEEAGAFALAASRVVSRRRPEKASTRTDRQRLLIVVADDYGIGPATSQAILDLAGRGIVTSAVLLVNSPFAEDAVQAWQRLRRPMQLGWHPCLTLDRPVLPAERVPSLVRGDGSFWPLRAFLSRWALGQLGAAEMAAELQAQYDRFVYLAGQPPALISSHHHIQLFSPVGKVLTQMLSEQRPRPYFRRPCEPWRTLAGIPGARAKRTFLATFGRRQARRRIIRRRTRRLG